MRAIPKQLLIHSAILRAPNTSDRWQKEQSDTVNLQYIRIDPSSKVINKPNSISVQLTGILYFDCKHSTPKEPSFQVGQEVLFDGELHRIETVEKLYDGRKLHHYEVGLV